MLAAGPGGVEELTECVYGPERAGVEGRPQLLRAAEMMLRAHLRKLLEGGRVEEREGRFELTG